MDLLLNPDIAYFLIVAGTFLALMAFATPGSGIAELGALFCLVLAGYSVYHLSINWWALGILILSLVPFILALRNPGRESWLIVSILGLSIGSVFFFPTGHNLPSVTPGLAIITSIVYAAGLWFVLRKVIVIRGKKPSFDLATLIGQQGESKTPVERQGSVQVAGELWSARSEKPIPAGSAIRVLGREGFVLIIEKENS